MNNNANDVDSNKLLNSLALLGTSILNVDYISTFIPFVATIIQNKKYDCIDIGCLKNDFMDEYGFKIPRAPMTTILTRCTNKGLIERRDDGHFYSITDCINTFSFSSNQQKTSNAYNKLIDIFVNYCDKEYRIHVEKTKAEDIYMKFLDRYSPKTLSGDLEIDGNYKDEENKYLFLMGSFIQYLYKTNNYFFDEAKKMSMAHIIATAITYDVDVDNNLEEYKDLVLYLDTPIVLRLLGLQTEEFKASYVEMFSAFNESIKPEYRIFTHTLDEICGILKDSLYWIDNVAYNPKFASPALLSFIKRNFTKLEIDLYIQNIKNYLSEIDISVDENEYYSKMYDSYQIDEEILYSKLVDTYKQYNKSFDINKKKETIETDIKSITNIVKLRAGKSSRTFSSARYLFLTCNATLAYVCRNYLREYKGKAKNQKAPCVTDYYLSTMVWLSSSTQKLENYNHAKLLADCSAATKITDELVNQFMASLERLTQNKKLTAKDYLLLRTHAFDNNYIEKRTLNEECAFTDKLVEEVLEDIKEELVAPYKEELNQKERKLEEINIKNKELMENLNQLHRQSEGEIKLLEMKDYEYVIKAQKDVEVLIVGLIPISVASIAFCIACFTVIQSNNIIICNTLKIISPLISLLSLFFTYSIKTNKWELKKRIEKYFIKRHKISDYKKGF